MDDIAFFKVKEASLDTVCGFKSTFPDNKYPEFVFAGKSNVGKSTLINALMERKKLARTSQNPGKTATVNYYKLTLIREGGLIDKNTDTIEYCAGEKTLHTVMLVDLPGYGFTNTSLSTRASYGKLAERYLHESKSIHNIFLLVDLRHKPSNDDLLMYDFIVSNGFKPIIIATKADKLKKNEKTKAIKEMREIFNIHNEDDFIPYSAVTKEGLGDILELLCN